MESGEIRKNTRLNIYSDEEVQVSIFLPWYLNIWSGCLVKCMILANESFLAFHALLISSQWPEKEIVVSIQTQEIAFHFSSKGGSNANDIPYSSLVHIHISICSNSALLKPDDHWLVKHCIVYCVGWLLCWNVKILKCSMSQVSETWQYQGSLFSGQSGPFSARSRGTILEDRAVTFQVNKNMPEIVPSHSSTLRISN